MGDPGWEMRKQLLFEAMEKPEGERDGFLAVATEGNVELRDDLASLLKCAAEPDERFDVAAGLGEFGNSGEDGVGDREVNGSDAFDSGWLRPGSIVGRYKIIGLLGSGGMGDVFEAEQDRPRRLVALKVLRAGPTTTEAQRRFEFEAEALGRLHHPGIAQVYEAGSFRLGESARRPFLAMELVKGVPLVEFADGAKLDIRERLQLLVRVCEAVEHAHQRGVIHRDLKPANILVDCSGASGCQPKLLDFGIARSVDDGNPDNPRTQATRAGDILGTVQYMSPEQLSGDANAVTTRTDVYAVGVIAYRLLTGQYPYGRLGSVMGAAEAIRTREPTAPSVHDAELRGDLDTVLRKAIEKEPAKRYESAAALGAEFSRVLADRPIEARSASAAYRARKFVRRNKGAVAAGVAVLIAMAVGTGVATWQAVRATRSQTRVAERSIQLRELVRALFGAYDKLVLNSGTMEARKQLAEKVPAILDRLAEESSDASELRSDIADAYARLAKIQGFPRLDNLGDYEGAIRNYQKATGIYSGLVADDPTDVALGLRELQILDESTCIFEYLKRTEESVKGYSLAIEKSSRLVRGHPENIELWANAGGRYEVLVRCLSDVNQIDAARKIAADARKFLVGLPAPDLRDANSVFHVGQILVQQVEIASRLGDIDGAREAAQRALPTLAQADAIRNGHGDTILAIGDVHRFLGLVLMHASQLRNEAAEEFRLAGEAYRRQVALVPSRLDSLHILGGVQALRAQALSMTGDLADAEEAARCAEEAMATRGALAAKDPESEFQRVSLVWTLQTCADAFVNASECDGQEVAKRRTWGLKARAYLERARAMLEITPKERLNLQVEISELRQQQERVEKSLSAIQERQE